MGVVHLLQRESRTCLMDLPIGRVEDLRRSGDCREKSAEDFCGEYQVCLPYRGIFVWHVAGEAIVGDSNQIVFVRAGESYQMSEPVPGGYGELVITPDVAALSEIARVNGGGLFSHPLFSRRCRRADAALQSIRTRFLHCAAAALYVDGLEAEELLLALLRSAFQGDEQRRARCGARTAGLIRQTKEVLEAELSNRLRLTDVARIVGASPAYLTDVFRRIEGMSLYQYLMHLRLARALVELPDTNDLTALALDLGFSSHSHFSAAFRRAFGCTPSKFRQTTRRARVQ